MITIEFQSEDGFAENMRAILHNALDEIGGGGFAPTGLVPEDADLRAFWIQELRESIGEDMRCLGRVLNHPDFDKGRIRISESQAEGLLRAAASLRLAIRRVSLADIPDSDLENARVRPEELGESICLAYITYLFLAGFQEVIIRALDSHIQD